VAASTPALTQGAADFLQPTEPRWTKVFERVPGATIEGSGPADTTVRAQVEMQMPGSDETFTYHQVAGETDENGGVQYHGPLLHHRLRRVGSRRGATPT